MTELVDEIKKLKQQIAELSQQDVKDQVLMDQLQLKLTNLLLIYKLQIQVDLTKVKLLETLRSNQN